MNSCVRKIRRAADMIGVEVSEDDVADVVAAEAQAVELVWPRLQWTETRVG